MGVWLPGAPHDADHDLDGTYCGYPATQAPIDYVIWTRILDEHPVELIVELGTAWGGFALYLSHLATAHGIGFVTFDRVDHRTAGPDRTFGNREAAAADLGDAFVCADVLANPEVVIGAIRGRRVVLLCDNGDKPREVALFAPELRPGSVLVAHDWGTEIGWEDIPLCLIQLYGDWCDENHSASRVFLRI